MESKEVLKFLASLSLVRPEPILEIGRTDYSTAKALPYTLTGKAHLSNHHFGQNHDSHNGKFSQQESIQRRIQTWIKKWLWRIHCHQRGQVLEYT